MNVFFRKNFKKLLTELESEYDRQVTVAEQLQKQLNDFRKDKEIQRLDAQIEDLHHRSLLIMSPKEQAAAYAFRNHHYQKCGNGNTFSYDLAGTAIGTGITIRCPTCGESEDITDLDCC